MINFLTEPSALHKGKTTPIRETPGSMLANAFTCLQYPTKSVSPATRQSALRGRNGNRCVGYLASSILTSATQFALFSGFWAFTGNSWV
jgi:hypothetical protein